MAIAVMVCLVHCKPSTEKHIEHQPDQGIPVQGRFDNLFDTDERGTKRIDIDLSQPSDVQLDIPHTATPQLVAYRVMGPVTGLQLKDELLPPIGDVRAWVQHLTRNASTDRQKAEALFQFVVHDIRDWYYPAQGLDLTVEDLGVLIWNFGYGFCYDMGRLQAGLWHEAGLRSRIVAWPQHTLAEVYYDDAWHLYDLQHRSFYEKPDGSVASFAEIKQDPTLFQGALNQLGLDPIGYPPHHMAHWYQIANPRFEDSADRAYWKIERSFAFDLRLGEYVDVIYTEPAVTYHPDSWAQYYGEMTLRKDPPWPVQGRLVYAPSHINQSAQWAPTTTPEGKPGYVLNMKSPFLFTEAWVKVPGISAFPRVWVHVWGNTQFAGRLVGGNALISKLVQGSNDFSVIVEDMDEDLSAALAKAEIHTRLQLSHIGLPKLRPGRNLLPLLFEHGTPHLSAWYLEYAPDLRIANIKTSPRYPRVGEPVDIIVTVENVGSGPSQPTQLNVNNNTTVLMSETIRSVGITTIPSLKPGRKTSVQVPWVANTEMTWYGQNPNVQLIDAWLDIEKMTADANRDNNRLQHYVVLKHSDGRFPELPGYQPLH